MKYNYNIIYNTYKIKYFYLFKNLKLIINIKLYITF